MINSLMPISISMQLLINFISMFFFTGGTSLSDDFTRNSNLHSNARIYRGQDAPKNKYPFYVDLFITFDNAKDGNGEKLMKHGSGVLISKIHILTTAHIFYPYKGKKKYVKDTYKGEAYAGGLDVAAFNNGTSDDVEMIEFYDDDVTLYPNNQSPAYEKGNTKTKQYANGENFFLYDIALINAEIKPFNQLAGHSSGIIVKPICLDNFKPYPPDQTNPEFTIVGMGLIREENNSQKPTHPSKLQFAKLKQVPAKKCLRTYLPKLKNKPLPKDFKESIKKGFCLKGKKKETPCSGDSGAPAFWYDKKGEPYLGGIMYIAQLQCGRRWLKSGKTIWKWDIPKFQKKSVAPSRYVKISGVIFKWLQKEGGSELKKMIENC